MIGWSILPVAKHADDDHKKCNGCISGDHRQLAMLGNWESGSSAVSARNTHLLTRKEANPTIAKKRSFVSVTARGALSDQRRWTQKRTGPMQQERANSQLQTYLDDRPHRRSTSTGYYRALSKDFRQSLSLDAHPHAASGCDGADNLAASDTRLILPSIRQARCLTIQTPRLKEKVLFESLFTSLFTS